MTDRTHPTDKESPMTKHDRHDELKALLSKISEESVTTSDVLDDMLDLLRERLPEPEDVKDETTRCSSVRPGHADFVCTMPSGHAGKHGYAGVFWSQPAPADDLPGEPVEPGDLRAGDRVAFTWMGERITGNLVSDPVGSILRSDTPDPSGYTPGIVNHREWCSGTYDVRLIERAPREDDDSAFDNAMRTIATLEARAKKAEAERDEWKARHEALREDVETRWAFVDDNFLKDILHSILKGDDERAKGEQR